MEHGRNGIVEQLEAATESCCSVRIQPFGGLGLGFAVVGESVVVVANVVGFAVFGGPPPPRDIVSTRSSSSTLLSLSSEKDPPPSPERYLSLIIDGRREQTDDRRLERGFCNYCISPQLRRIKILIAYQN